MKRRQGGYTLVEIMVVVFIIALLAKISIPMYFTALENSKADDAVSTLQAVAMANRSFFMDNSQYAVGQLTDSCASTTCQCSNGSCTGTSACNLVVCHYLTITTFDSRPYQFFALNGATSGPDSCSLGATGTLVACTMRVNGPAPGTTASPFNKWGYTADTNSRVTPYPAASGPPAPPS